MESARSSARRGEELLAGQAFESRLRAKLDADEVRQNLARAGLVLAIYEFVKFEIINGVRDFFVILNTGGDRYKAHVLERAPETTFKASCLWLQDMNVLHERDYETLKALQEHRHTVTHDLVAYVVDPNTEINMDLVRQATEVLRRLGQFWGRIEVDTNPEFDGQEVTDEDIRSGPSILVDFLLNVVDSQGRTDP